MTVAQNVAFPLRQHTRKRAAEIEEIVLARLGEVGLTEQVGLRSRRSFPAACETCRLARALALEPEVVLYDEPTTASIRS